MPSLSLARANSINLQNKMINDYYKQKIIDILSKKRKSKVNLRINIPKTNTK